MNWSDIQVNRVWWLWFYDLVKNKALVKTLRMTNYFKKQIQWWDMWCTTCGNEAFHGYTGTAQVRMFSYWVQAFHFEVDNMSLQYHRMANLGMSFTAQEIKLPLSANCIFLILSAIFTPNQRLNLSTGFYQKQTSHGYWLQPGPARAAEAIWGGSQQMENLSLSVILPFK